MYTAHVTKKGGDKTEKMGSVGEGRGLHTD